MKRPSILGGFSHFGHASELLDDFLKLILDPRLLWTISRPRNMTVTLTLSPFDQEFPDVVQLEVQIVLIRARSKLDLLECGRV